MEISVDHLLAKIGQLTILLEGAQQRISELEAENARLKEGDVGRSPGT